jgi:copper chaperone for superoxide dismutase
MVQVSPSLTLFDITIRGVSPGTYFANIRTAGDISRGPSSTGGIWDALLARKEGREARGVLGTVQVSENGIGTVFLDKPIQIWELIGRSIVVSKTNEGPFKQTDADTLVGVIARSAGVWDNDKTVCSCTGKTVWEERKDQVDRGML